MASECPDTQAAWSAIRFLLGYVGEDVNRHGLIDTPKRVASALLEMTSGYRVDTGILLSKQFRCDTDDLVAVRDIPFASMCEHHMLPFVGTANVAYIPSNDSVVGLSKIARLVDAYARRLQLQERMTTLIARDIEKYVSRDVAVQCRATHSCMAIRGAEKPGATMVTCSLLGRFKSDPKLRAEVLSSWGA